MKDKRNHNLLRKIIQMDTHHEVRFHLASGKNYMHWQVKVMQGRKKLNVCYYDPNDYQLEMINCKLVNKLNKAKKVHKAGKKDVAGWVKCDEVILTKCPVDNLERVFYNPISDIHWRRSSDAGEFSWDNSEYQTLITNNKQVYILEERA
jgi:hypothetical protein